MSDPRQELDLGQECERRGDLAAAAAHYHAAAGAAGDDSELASEALRLAAVMHHMMSAWEEALAAAEQAARVAEAAGLRDAYGAALNATASVHQVRGDFEAARRTYEQVLGLAPSDRVRGVALQNLGTIAAQSGSWELARRRFDQSRRCFQRAGYARGEAFAVINYGCAALDHGNFRLAAELLADARAVAAKHGDPGLHAMASLNYAEAISQLDRKAESAQVAAAALEVFVATGNTWRRVEALRLLGDLAKAAGDGAGAAARWGEALTLAEQIGAGREAESLRERLQSAG